MMTVWNTWHVLPQAVRGQPAGAAVGPAKAGRDEHEHVSFIMAMHSLAMAGRADELARQVDLGSAGNLLDVGGGPGTYTMALLDRYPDLRATLFDLPQTIAIARANIQRFNLADRITLRQGNWNDDEFGDGFDAVLMSNILHGPDDDTPMKLGKAHDALSAGGLLIVQDFLLNDRRDGPLVPALFNLMVGAWALGEMIDQVEQAGFSVLRHAAMGEDTGQTVIIARRDG
jgi:SAM-dependent methyltransferase